MAKKVNIADRIAKLANTAPAGSTTLGRPSKFAEHKAAIVQMRRRRFSWKRIHEVLNEGGLECSYLGLITWKGKNIKASAR